MKRKITIAVVAILTFSLILTGCGVVNPTASAATETDVNYAYAGNGNGYTTSAEAVEVGAGYRGGNENAGTGYSDDCDPVYDDNTPDPDYTLTAADQTLSLAGYGSEGALDDTSLTLADMLTYAIQDEYLAYAEYDRILSENGSIRPFTNIIRAEATHIDALLPLFETYGIAAPADEGASHAVSVATLTEAYQAGVNAEVNNIAMYETFLDQDLPSDVRIVFESLMHASENHLRAFQNQL